MKKILALFLVLSLVFTCAACGAKGTQTATDTGAKGGTVTDTGGQGSAETGKKDKIKIGVSIWSSTDTLGSQCKMILDAAAKALGVELVYVDQNHISEKVTASMETLAAAGCDGVIICNSSSAEMTSVINTANENKIYVAQFFRSINKESNPNEYQLAVSSPYYVGTVHEDEVDNGYKLVQVLAEKGYRKIALMGWEPGDATFLARWEGYKKKGVEGWNKEHP
jgi:family.